MSEHRGAAGADGYTPYRTYGGKLGSAAPAAPLDDDDPGEIWLNERRRTLAARRSIDATADIDAALQVCGLCPTRLECLDWAIETGDFVAILGGMTPAARRLKKRRKTGTEEATDATP